MTGPDWATKHTHWFINTSKSSIHFRSSTCKSNTKAICLRTEGNKNKTLRRKIYDTKSQRKIKIKIKCKISTWPREKKEARKGKPKTIRTSFEYVTSLTKEKPTNHQHTDRAVTNKTPTVDARSDDVAQGTQDFTRPILIFLFHRLIPYQMITT